ncbi:MAG TPA: hydroxymethylbilane synthase [Methanoregulaceae archaeon]|nr:hydroxymethylbilane synthase [Methanoregulaceae archaeon]
MVLRIGTRGSKLALAQAGRVCSMLETKGFEVEQKIITTEGDTVTGVPLHEVGGQGVFVRALDDAIVNDEIDAAVHSMKDIPAVRPPGLVTSAVLARDSPADFLAFQRPLSEVAVIGTSSTRRSAQIRRHDPVITVKPLRGNVDTRIRKLSEGEYDAIVLAEAGLQRLGITLPGQRLPPEQFVPSPNQGTIAVVSRLDPSLSEIMSLLDDPGTRQDVAMERAVMEQVGGGCYTPLGVYCRNAHLIAEVLSLDGTCEVRIEEDLASVDHARERGRELRVRARDLIREAYAALGLKDEAGG